MAERIVAFAGSLRQRSFNRALIRAAGDPVPVAAFKEAIRRADGLLIATPEHNDGLPGALTNAIDWASRLPGRSALIGKPVAIMGASPSQVGTARAQLHLRQVLAHTQARLLPPPELLVGSAQQRFDAELRLVDEATRRIMGDLLRRFEQWIARERAAREATVREAERTARAGTAKSA